MQGSGSRFDPRELREALKALPTTQAWENLSPPDARDIYIPAMHEKALLPDVSIVQGMRGAGKSFWTAVLANDDRRQMVAGIRSVPGLSNLIVRVGFGLAVDNEDFPTTSTIQHLLSNECTADGIWQSVLLRHALKALTMELPFEDAVEAAALWVKREPRQADSLIAECDSRLDTDSRTLLLLFDSLERLANDWRKIREILSSALRLGLECRTRKAIRMKFFLRPDMVEEDDAVWRFPDSSKLLHSKRELSWRPNDLFGLVLQHLANSPTAGRAFRAATADRNAVAWTPMGETYPVPQSLISDEESMRRIVEDLAGQWVGTSAKRGFTFKWIPTHLADAKGRISPRSILLALRHAAEWTDSRHPTHHTPLHYEGIQQGVVEASKIRIGEIKEDYPWVGPLLDALKGETVPLTMAGLTQRWTPTCVNEAMKAAEDLSRLPPRRFSNDKDNMGALVDDLVELAMLYRTEDERLNMPDIFRVGFGIKRKGGVRPPR